MKKSNLILGFVFALLVALASCTGGLSDEAKTVTLKNQEDSLNFALGVSNGEGIKMNFLYNDSTGESLKALLEAADKAFKNKNAQSQIYKYGQQIGSMLKQQKRSGLMFDSTLVFDEKLMIQGIINGMKGLDNPMTAEAAREYIEKTMQKIHGVPEAEQSEENDTTTNDSISVKK